MTTSPSTGLSGLPVAIVHEWLDAPGGAENVLRQMIAELPHADVWSLWCQSPAKETIPADVRTTWLARTPLAGRKLAALPLMPFVWRTLPPRTYDVVITSSYALAHTAKFRKSDALTFHYIHTPARYWWTPEIDGRAGGNLASMPRWAMRHWDRRRAMTHQNVVANSMATRRRINDFWGIEAGVISPPVDTEFFTPGEPLTDLPFDQYLVGASRWVPYKRLDLVIRTAQAAGLPAVIAGSGPEESRLRELARNVDVPVHLELQPDRSRLRDLYRGASALVFPVHEDFGIVPVEAMACGTPVVGPAVGGLLETVVDGVSGILTDSTEPDALAQALMHLDSLDRDRIRGLAIGFSEQRFRTEFADWITSALLERIDS